MSCTLTNLVKRYRAPERGMVTVLDIPHFCIHDGDRIALTGASGAGKSTLLHCLAGTLRAEGSIRHAWRDGVADLVGLSERARDRFRATTLGCVFQGAPLLAGLGALENVLLAARVTGRPLDAVWAEHLLRTFGLGERLGHHPHQLSPGQRLRVACARALVGEPALLLIDEPTASLDPATAALVLEQVLTLARATGAAVLVITHDAEVAARLDRRVALADISRASAAAPVPTQGMAACT